MKRMKQKEEPEQEQEITKARNKISSREGEKKKIIQK